MNTVVKEDNEPIDVKTVPENGSKHEVSNDDETSNEKETSDSTKTEDNNEPVEEVVVKEEEESNGE